MAGLSSTDKVFFGTAGGLGEVFSCNPAIFRILFVILFLCYGTGLGLYLACTLILLILGMNNNQGK